MMGSSFHVDVAKWVAKATDNMNTVVRQVVTGIVHGVDSRSPVGNRELWAINDQTMMNREMYQVFREESGKARVSKRTLSKKFALKGPKGYKGGHFRANNQLGVDRMFVDEIDKIDPSGEVTTAANLDAIPKDAAGHVYFLVNNVPYAQVLEEGHSTQAPNGMYGLTALEFQLYINEAMAGLPK